MLPSLLSNELPRVLSFPVVLQYDLPCLLMNEFIPVSCPLGIDGSAFGLSFPVSRLSSRLYCPFLRLLILCRKDSLKKRRAAVWGDILFLALWLLRTTKNERKATRAAMRTPISCARTCQYISHIWSSCPPWVKPMPRIMVRTTQVMVRQREKPRTNFWVIETLMLCTTRMGMTRTRMVISHCVHIYPG